MDSEVKQERGDVEQTSSDNNAMGLFPLAFGHLEPDIIIKEEPPEEQSQMVGENRDQRSHIAGKDQHRQIGARTICRFWCDQCFQLFTTVAEWDRHVKLGNAMHVHPPVRRCGHCKREMRATDIDFRAHWRTHETRRLYPCPHCGKRFTVRKYVTAHVKSVHKRLKKYQCSVCGKCFKSPDIMRSHHMTHTGEKPFKCRYCEKGFCWQYSLQCHERTHTGYRPYVCKVEGCNFKACDGSSLRYHTQTVHSSVRRYACGRCGKRFVKPHEVKQHIRQVHEHERTVPCEVCGKLFFSNCIMQKHKLTHSEERPVECAVCGSRFKTNQNMTTHMRTHTAENLFECHVCKKRFKFTNYLKKHLDTHNTELNFTCECGKKFKSWRCLTRHKSICGDTTKRYGCHFCSKRFRAANNASKHMLLFHTRVPSMWCLECGTLFKRSGTLVNHYTKFHAEAGPFSCPDCGFCVKEPAEYARHLAKMHVTYTNTNAVRTDVTRMKTVEDVSGSKTPSRNLPRNGNQQASVNETMGNGKDALNIPRARKRGRPPAKRNQQKGEYEASCVKPEPELQIPRSSPRPSKSDSKEERSTCSKKQSPSGEKVRSSSGSSTPKLKRGRPRVSRDKMKNDGKLSSVKPEPQLEIIRSSPILSKCNGKPERSNCSKDRCSSGSSTAKRKRGRPRSTRKQIKRETEAPCVKSEPDFQTTCSSAGLPKSNGKLQDSIYGREPSSSGSSTTALQRADDISRRAALNSRRTEQSCKGKVPDKASKQCAASQKKSKEYGTSETVTMKTEKNGDDVGSVEQSVDSSYQTLPELMIASPGIACQLILSGEVVTDKAVVESIENLVSICKTESLSANSDTYSHKGEKSNMLAGSSITSVTSVDDGVFNSRTNRTVVSIGAGKCCERHFRTAYDINHNSIPLLMCQTHSPQSSLKGCEEQPASTNTPVQLPYQDDCAVQDASKDDSCIKAMNGNKRLTNANSILNATIYPDMEGDDDDGEK